MCVDFYFGDVMSRLTDHIYIASTIVFTVYSQLIIRWQVSHAGPLPADFAGKFIFIGRLFFNPWVLTSILATLLSGISWMLAMSRFEISYAYPWISFNFVLVLVFGVLLFGETLSPWKIIGTLFVVIGLAIMSRG